MQNTNTYSVYMHISPNEKKYIGITCKKPEHRWSNGNGYIKNTYFFNAIIKYGWDNFQHIIIAKGLSKEEACSLEKALIAGCKTTSPENGYNMSIGGESGTNGIKFGPEFGEKVRKRVSGKNNPNYGKKFSEETRKKLSEARKGRWSPKQKEALTKVHEKMCVPVICLDTKTIYNSITEAAKETNGTQSGIKNVCKQKQISSHGLHWAYYKGQSNEEIDSLLKELKLKKEMVYKVRKSWNKGMTYKTGRQKNPCKSRRKRKLI